MADPIEALDRRRRNYLAVYLVSFGVFFITFVVRFIFKNAEALTDRMDWALRILLALSLPFQAWGALGLSAVRRRVRRDPEKYAALYDELVKYQELRAWRFGFMAMAASLAVFLVVAIFHGIKDIPSPLFISLWSGFGGYYLSFFMMNRG